MPITPKQLAALLCEASQAWISVAKVAWTPPVLTTNHARFNWWRKNELAELIGTASYKEIENSQFLQVRAHFQKFYDSAAAFGSAHKHESDGDKISIARRKLSQALKDHGLNPAYAEGISRNIFKKAVASLDDRQLWRLVFTINNRGRAKTDREEASAETDPHSDRRNKKQTAARKAKQRGADITPIQIRNEPLPVTPSRSTLVMPRLAGRLSGPDQQRGGVQS